MWTGSVRPGAVLAAALALFLALPSCAASSAVSAIFNDIYEHKRWSPAGGGSGEGSTLAYTVGARHILDEVVQANNITTIGDVPCGSFHRMSTFMHENPQIDYTGVDIVDLGLAKTHKDDPNLHFIQGDISVVPLPSVDLILSRDALQHLPFSIIRGTLRNIQKADPKFFLVGSYPEAGQNNTDIPIGSYFKIDLRRQPFSLGEPMEDYPEHTVRLPRHTPGCRRRVLTPFPSYRRSSSQPDAKHLYLYSQAQIRAWKLPKQLRKALS